MSLERDLLSSTITPRPRKRCTLRIATVAILAAIIAASAASAVAVIASRRADHATGRAQIAERIVVAADQFQQAEEQAAVGVFLRRQRVIFPEQLARAIVASTRDRREQRLLASVAVVESRGNPLAIGKRGERGAYQVRPDLHGAVPTDLDGQTTQALEIIREQTSRYGVRKGIRSYNGHGKAADRYATTVLAYAGEIQ